MKVGGVADMLQKIVNATPFLPGKRGRYCATPVDNFAAVDLWTVELVHNPDHESGSLIDMDLDPVVLIQMHV